MSSNTTNRIVPTLVRGILVDYCSNGERPDEKWGRGHWNSEYPYQAYFFGASEMLLADYPGVYYPGLGGFYLGVRDWTLILCEHLRKKQILTLIEFKKWGAPTENSINHWMGAHYPETPKYYPPLHRNDPDYKLSIAEKHMDYYTVVPIGKR